MTYNHSLSYYDRISYSAKAAITGLAALCVTGCSSIRPMAEIRTNNDGIVEGRAGLIIGDDEPEQRKKKGAAFWWTLGGSLVAGLVGGYIIYDNNRSHGSSDYVPPVDDAPKSRPTYDTQKDKPSNPPNPPTPTGPQGGDIGGRPRGH